ncbi:hypothetical protein HanIR_Chr04g0205441 [Helianthus annuus]|nr:hypothetical protein HanIR_Chr04g0205441 [Helianthus annuus]
MPQSIDHRMPGTSFFLFCTLHMHSHPSILTQFYTFPPNSSSQKIGDGMIYFCNL